jgi:tRNA nucleotidyltransferase/poly(A) polymerase
MDRRFTPLSWLKADGHRAYLVGNQSRNKLLGINYDPKDIDVATSALPTTVVSLLHRRGIIPAYIDESFGVITFNWEGSVYEIATFRRDIYDEQFDHIKRAPKQIVFIDDLDQDAHRRDFTINAIYWDPITGHLIDPLDGRSDLNRKILRLIGDADIRLKEDPVRILRAIRFKYDLKLRYDPKTAAAIRRQAKLVHKLPVALLKREFHKIQNLPRYPLARKEMQKLGLVGRF